jgi:prophage regulatory protein
MNLNVSRSSNTSRPQGHPPPDRRVLAPQVAAFQDGTTNGHSVAGTTDRQAPDPNPPIVILRLPLLAQRIGLCRSAIYARISPSSKYFEPSFPRPISLSGPGMEGTCHHRRTAVGWIESEVDAWLAQRSSERAGP